MNILVKILRSHNVRNSLKHYLMTNKINFSTNNAIKTIEFKTCGQLYQELKKKSPKLYKNSPSNGLTVSVEYVDTFGDTQNTPSVDVKTVVAIHGNPGHHKHFSQLIDYFNDRSGKVRVIVPNLPDFTLTRQSMAFWHSNQERSQFIRDFLNAINVSTIDCLISHSVGIHPISLIWTDPQELTVKSIGLFSPQYLPERFYVIVRSLAVFCRTKWGIKLMDTYKPHMRAKAILPVSFSKVDEVLCFFLLQSDIKNSEYFEYLENLRTKQIPTFVVYGHKDAAIPEKDYQEFTRRLGADQKDLNVYSDSKGIEKDSERENWIKVLSFKSGGHFCYAKYSQEVCRQLAKHCLQI